MHVFSDSTFREWQLSITIASIKRVRDLMAGAGQPGIVLSDYLSGEPTLLGRLQTDLVLLADVIYCLCKPEADRLGISDEAFGAALGGDAMGAAAEAFFAELIDFFQRPRPEAAAMIQTTLAALQTRRTEAAAAISATATQPAT